MNLFRRAWIALTYWPVPCESCSGTGICSAIIAGQPPSRPHSCCGDCKRIRVEPKDVPAGFQSDYEIAQGMKPLIGDGIMWRRPWSKQQVMKP